MIHLRPVFEPGVLHLHLMHGDTEIASYNLTLPAHDLDVAEAVERLCAEAEDNGIHLRGGKRQALFRAIAMGTPV